MNKDIENLLTQQFTDNDAYKTPEGYFDTLTSRIMSNIPDERVNAASKKNDLFRFRYAAAACITVALVGIGALIYNMEREEFTEQTANIEHAEQLNEQYVDDCMEYAMVDNDDVYQYLSEQ